MKNSIALEMPLLPRRRRKFARRVRVILRLTLRKLFRDEVVETDARGRPKAVPFRWMT
jgi:hypothetical protein